MRLLFAALCAAVTAHLLNTALYRTLRELPEERPLQAVSVPARSSPVQAILARNLLAARIGEKQEASPCTLSANIAGIITGDPSLLVYRSGQDTLLATVGYPLPGNVRLVSLRPGSATFLREQHAETCGLWSDSTAPNDSAKNGAFLIPRSRIQWAQEHLPELMRDARVVPSFQHNGGVHGFKLFSIRPGSLYEELGLQNGDVIERVNGQPITNPSDAMELYGRLRDASAVELTLERRGSPYTIAYQIR